MENSGKITQRIPDEVLGERFKVLTNASPDCIKLFNLENKIEYMNPGGLAEHGFKSLEEAIGFDWTQSIIPEQREEIRRLIKESVAEKKTVSLDVKHLPQYANREWCNLIISPVFDEEGNVKYFVGISRDITGRKNDEERVRKYAEELEGLSRTMVDRGLKMADMENEIERLKERCEPSKKDYPVV